MCKLKSNLILVLLSTLFLIPHAPAIHAGTQAQNAVRQVKDLINQGAIEQGSVLKIVVKQGNINNYWGRDFELKKEWESATGTLLDANVRPQLPALSYMREHKDFDITVARNREYADLWVQGLIEDLTPYMARFGFSIRDDTEQGFILPELQSYFDNKTVAVPADNDIALMYLRQDLLEDPAIQRKYKKRYNRDLEIPQTWDEYLNQISFFHNYTPGFYGCCEQRDPLTGWMFWMPRYLSRGVPTRELFDDQMRPLIDSPEGIAATKSYIATVPFSPPDILKLGNDYSYTLPFYKRGDCYSYILTPSGAKLFNLESSKVKDKFITVVLPGVLVSDQLVQRSTYIYGNNLVIASSSKNKELAFLYLMWLTDPDISSRSVVVKNGFADPFRYNHLTNQLIEEIYTKQAIETIRASIDITAFAATGIQGDAEYMEALNKNLFLAALGKISAEKAMHDTSEQWEQITEKYGRENQIKIWREQRKLYPK